VERSKLKSGMRDVKKSKSSMRRFEKSRKVAKLGWRSGILGWQLKGREKAF